MKIERAYLRDAIRQIRGKLELGRPRPVIYRTTGELVESGLYHCTLCGSTLHHRRPGSLPLCATCDGAEFIAGRVGGDWEDSAPEPVDPDVSAA